MVDDNNKKKRRGLALLWYFTVRRKWMVKMAVFHLIHSINRTMTLELASSGYWHRYYTQRDFRAYITNEYMVNIENRMRKKINDRQHAHINRCFLAYWNYIMFTVLSTFKPFRRVHIISFYIKIFAYDFFPLNSIVKKKIYLKRNIFFFSKKKRNFTFQFQFLCWAGLW